MADVIIDSSNQLADRNNVPNIFPKKFPYKLTFEFDLKLFGGWFVFWSTLETTQTLSVRNTWHYNPPNSTWYPDEESGPYPILGAEQEGVAALHDYLVKLGINLDLLGTLTYEVQAIDPTSVARFTYSPLSLTTTSTDNYPGSPGVVR